MTEARSDKIVWRPDKQIKADANLTAFMARQGVSDFDTLNRRAVTDPAWLRTSSGPRWVASTTSTATSISPAAVFPWMPTATPPISSTCSRFSWKQRLLSN
jgi:hypothetical protein